MSIGLFQFRCFRIEKWYRRSSKSQFACSALYLNLATNADSEQSALCLIVFSFLWMVSELLDEALICRPLAFKWDQGIPNGKCGNHIASFIVLSAFDFVGDIVGVVLFVWPLHRLQVPWSRKVLPGTLLSIAFLDIFMPVVIIALFLRELAVSGRDLRKFTFEVYLVILVRPGVAVTLACLATLGSAAKVMGRFCHTLLIRVFRTDNERLWFQCRGDWSGEHNGVMLEDLEPPGHHHPGNDDGENLIHMRDPGADSGTPALLYTACTSSQTSCLVPDAHLPSHRTKEFPIPAEER